MSIVIDYRKCASCKYKGKECLEGKLWQCKALVPYRMPGRTTYLIDPSKCDNCGDCVKACPEGAISLE